MYIFGLTDGLETLFFVLRHIHYDIYMREIFFVALHGEPPIFFHGLCYVDGNLCFFFFFVYDGLSEIHSCL